MDREDTTYTPWIPVERHPRPEPDIRRDMLLTFTDQGGARVRLMGSEPLGPAQPRPVLDDMLRSSHAHHTGAHTAPGRYDRT